MLSPEELQSGYFGSRQLAGVFPTPISELAAYNQEEILSLSCTQLNLSATMQKKVVREWVAALPKLPIKHLLFWSKVDQELFDAAVQIPGLESLYIKWSSIKSIEAIKQCKTLKALHIGSSPSLTGLNNLRELGALFSLTLENSNRPPSTVCHCCLRS